jgi:hypothetical protein
MSAQMERAERRGETTMSVEPARQGSQRRFAEGPQPRSSAAICYIPYLTTRYPSQPFRSDATMWPLRE